MTDTDCTCNRGPDYEGPDIDCPVHGQLAPPRDLGPPVDPAPDVTSGPVGTPPVDITETIIDLTDMNLGPGQSFALHLDVDTSGEVVEAEVVEEPRREHPHEAVVNDDLAVDKVFRSLLAEGKYDDACAHLAVHLQESEAVRRAMPERPHGDGARFLKRPVFGTGPAPDLHVAARYAEHLGQAIYAELLTRRLVAR